VPPKDPRVAAGLTRYRRWLAAVLVSAALGTLALIGYMSGGVLASSAAYGYCSGAQYQYCTTTTTGPIVGAALRSFTARRTTRGVLLRWHTASESGLVGFRLYRGQARKWARVNVRLVRSTGSLRGATHKYLDRRAPRSAVRYRLEAVRTDGKRAFSGLSRVLRPLNGRAARPAR
jgi:hypothetical protein